MKSESLLRHWFVDSFTFKIGDCLILPLFWPAHRAKVRKEQLKLKVKVCIEVLRLYIDLCSEKSNIIYLYFFFTIPYKKCSWGEGALVFYDTRRYYIVMINMLRWFHLLLFLLGHLWCEHTIWIRIEQLILFRFEFSFLPHRSFC